MTYQWTSMGLRQPFDKRVARVQLTVSESESELPSSENFASLYRALATSFALLTLQHHTHRSQRHFVVITIQYLHIYLSFST